MVWCDRCDCISIIERENWEYNQEIRKQISELILLKNRVIELNNEKKALLTTLPNTFLKEEWINDIDNENRVRHEESRNILRILNENEEVTKEILTTVNNLPLSQLSLKDIDFTATIPKLNMFRQILEASERTINIAVNMKRKLAEWNGHCGLAGNLTPNNLLRQQMDEIWMDLLDIQDKLSSIQEIIAEDEIGTRKKQQQLKNYFNYKLSENNFQEIHREALQKTNSNHLIADTVEYISCFQYIEDTLALQRYTIIRQITYWARKEKEGIYSRFPENTNDLIVRATRRGQRTGEIYRVFFNTKENIDIFSLQLLIEKLTCEKEHGFSEKSWEIQKMIAKNKWAEVIEEEEKRLTQLEQEKNKWVGFIKEEEKKMTQLEQENNKENANIACNKRNIKLLKQNELKKLSIINNSTSLKKDSHRKISNKFSFFWIVLLFIFIFSSIYSVFIRIRTTEQKIIKKKKSLLN